MAVKFVNGDLFETLPDVALAHGCNCAGAMGKGIAVEFKSRWPAMYSIYKKKCLDGEFVCGDVFWWIDPNSNRTIYNLGTQRTWRTKATLGAITSSIKKMLILAEQSGISTICMPVVGTGLGGLDKDTVKKAIVDIADASAVMFLVCENYVASMPPS